MNLPTQYLTREFPPTCAADFIGDARAEAEALERKVKCAKLAGFAPIKQFYSGPSGTGKTALCYYAEKLLGVTRWVTYEFNGTDVTIDVVRQWTDMLHLTHNEMFGPYRMIQIHEADAMSNQAQVGVLTLLDNLPAHTAIFCTSNATASDLEKRFQRRFKFTTIGPAKDNDILDLLKKWDVPPGVARQIAVTACGSVGLALQEAEEWLQTAVMA